MDPKERFTGRVENYTRYRPSYPLRILHELSVRIGLRPNDTVAEMGAGTGKFTELLLKHGNQVYAVEPNPQMREEAEKSFSYNPNFMSIPGSAEETKIPDRSVAHVFAAQSFHWFNVSAAKAEFRRILKPNGCVILLWNIRDTADPFMNRIESLIARYSTDYDGVGLSKEKRVQKIRQFFEPHGFDSFSVENTVPHTFSETIGFLKSASYIPLEGTEAFEALQNEVKTLFDEIGEEGKADFIHRTQVFYGKIPPV